VSARMRHKGWWGRTDLQWRGRILGARVIRKLTSLLHDALDGCGSCGVRGKSAKRSGEQLQVDTGLTSIVLVEQARDGHLSEGVGLVANVGVEGCDEARRCGVGFAHHLLFIMLFPGTRGISRPDPDLTDVFLHQRLPYFIRFKLQSRSHIKTRPFHF
jgi:hypothetical protein